MFTIYGDGGHHVNKYSFPCTSKLTYKIWLKRPSDFCVRQVLTFICKWRLGQGQEMTLTFNTKALLTLTPRPVRDLFATDFFATDWRSMRFVQPLYAHIRIEDYNRRLVGDRFATGLRLIGDWSPWTRRYVCNQVKPIGDQSATSRQPVGDWSPESFDAN